VIGPPIYSLIGAPVIGELGERSEVERFPECEVCERRPPTVVRFIELAVDAWSGEGLVAVAGYNYLVGDQLREAFEREQISGVRFEPAEVTKGDYFEVVPPARGRATPHFARMVIVGEAEGPELWWTSHTCPVCGVTSWTPTADGIAAQTSDLTGEEPAPREIYRSSWSGDDVFQLPDKGPPVVTLRFVDITERLEVSGLHLAPAKWVEE
jgi:hypothetical protein